jgi:hypothetical protein
LRGAKRRGNLGFDAIHPRARDRHAFSLRSRSYYGEVGSPAMTVALDYSTPHLEKTLTSRLNDHARTQELFAGCAFVTIMDAG